MLGENRQPADPAETISNTKTECAPDAGAGYRGVMLVETHRWVPWDHPLLAVLLQPLGWVYGVVMACRRMLYRLGVRRSHHLGVPCLSIGNLTVGGTGKTPMIDALLSRLEERGLRAMVLSRGYGAPVTMDGVTLNDEGHMLRRKHGGHVFVQKRDRLRAARAFLANGSVDIVLLDDGAQHLRIARDGEILMFDGSELLGARRVLPAGPWREFPAMAPVGALCVVTGPSAKDGAELLRQRAGASVCVATRQPLRTVAVDGGDPQELLATSGRRVGLLSAIGRPESFEQTARAAGLEVAWSIALPDHDALGAVAMRAAEKKAEGEPVDFLLTTAKDATKLDTGAIPCRVLEIELDLGEQWSMVEAVIDRVLAPSAH